MKRVVVTGMGAITPIGNSVDEFWAAVKKQTVGIGEITKMDATDYKVKLAAEVKGFDAREHMDAKTARRMEAFCHYAVAATEEALKDSDWICSRRILIVWASASVPASAVCRPLKESFKNCSRAAREKSAR